jgi:cyclomaltodextrinase
MIHGDYSRYVTDSGVDSITQYELWKAIWSALNDRNLFELAHALRRHDAMVRTFLPQTFVGNHDVTRLASRLTDRRHLAPALALLFALPGVPTVYYGDEFGFTGVKEDREGGDDAVRPAFPPHPEDVGSSGDALRALHQELIGLRRRHAWLVDARIEEPDVLTNEQLAVRLTAEGRQLALVLNLADQRARVAVPVPTADVLAGSGTAASDGATTLARVEPHSFLLIGDR